MAFMRLAQGFPTMTPARVFLLRAVWAGIAANSAVAATADAPFDSQARAARHAITSDRPAPDFFAGGLLGNGAMGVVVCTKPDSVVLHFGHNDVWDIRAESIDPKTLSSFDELWRKYKSGDRSWLAAYNKSATVPDSKPYPRPWPCGSLILAFDRRDAELLGHTVHIDSGICEVRFLVGGKVRLLRLFADMSADRLWMRMVDEEGKGVPAPFVRVALTPPAGMPTTMRGDDHSFCYRQTLAQLKPGTDKDQAVRVGFRSTYRMTAAGPKAPFQLPPPNFSGDGTFTGCVEITHGPAREIADGLFPTPEPTDDQWRKAAEESGTRWRDYWARSGIALDDEFLERIWYRNQYFMNSVCRPGSQCPGLYGNWISGDIGTVWHGEYVFDYNIQQTFWGVMSSNHPDTHLPYVDLIWRILPLAQRWAKDFYHLPGAFFAQIHWPVDTPSIPVPWFGWGNHMAPTPWAVQSLWWHYLYTADKGYLRDRAFGPIKEAVLFMDGYMRRQDAHGAGSPWKDDRFHIHPTQSPEIWAEHFGEPRFSDAIADLTLTKFVFRAYLRACRELGLTAQESQLMGRVEEILAHLPPYPTDTSPRGGRVFKDVEGATPDAVYNAPNPLMPVFPGEDYGLHSPPEILALASNTWRNQQNEGGNDLVFLSMQGARLGLLDLAKFKRQITYCLLPDGTCTDLTLQPGGRYTDKTANDYMARMGIWIENFALPGVINECLLQSYTGELRFFPNWGRDNGAARFQTLRAVGAFLVSASFRDGRTEWIRVTSEVGGPLRIINPWQGRVSVTSGGKTVELQGKVLEIPTRPGETLDLVEIAGTNHGNG